MDARDGKDLPSWLRSLVYLTQTLGFPIALAVFLLWREDKRIVPMLEGVAELTRAIDSMNETVVQLKTVVERQATVADTQKEVAEQLLDEVKKEKER